MAKIEQRRERVFFELDFTLHSLASCEFEIPPVDYGQERIIKALRLDALVGGDDATGSEVARGFAQILIGLRADIRAGVKLQSGGGSGWTFTRGILRADEVLEAPADELPHIQHAVLGPLPKDIPLPSPQTAQLVLHYDGPPVKCRFVRVVVLGLLTRHTDDW